MLWPAALVTRRVGRSSPADGFLHAVQKAYHVLLQTHLDANFQGGIVRRSFVGHRGRLAQGYVSCTAHVHELTHALPRQGQLQRCLASRGGVCVSKSLSEAGHVASGGFEPERPCQPGAEGIVLSSLFDGIGGARRALDVLGVAVRCAI